MSSLLTVTAPLAALDARNFTRLLDTGELTVRKIDFGFLEIGLEFLSSLL